MGLEIYRKHDSYVKLLMIRRLRNAYEMLSSVGKRHATMRSAVSSGAFTEIIKLIVVSPSHQNSCYSQWSRFQRGCNHGGMKSRA